MLLLNIYSAFHTIHHNTHQSDLHGVVLKSHDNLRVFDYLEEIAAVIDPRSVKSFGKIAGKNYGVFFESREECEKLLQVGRVLVKGTGISIEEYAPALKTVFIKGVPLLSSLGPLYDLLSKYGEVKSKLVRLPLKDVPESFAHVMSHTLSVKMVFDSEKDSLPQFAKVNFGCDIIKVKIECGFRKCYKCGDHGHLIKMCPKNRKAFPDVNGDGSSTESEIESVEADNLEVNNHQTSGTMKSDSVWTEIVKNGRTRKSRAGSKTRRVEILSSEESSPSTNVTKIQKTTNTQIEAKLNATFDEWKLMQIGNGHLVNEKLLQLLIEGCENVNNITNVAAKYSNNPSLLRKQLDALICKISDNDVKSFIKETLDAIPLRFPDSTTVSSINK